MQITNDIASEPCIDESIGSNQPDACLSLAKSPYVASAAEAVKNYRENPAAIWYKDNTDPNDSAGKYAFQRLRQTWFIPHVAPKFKLYRQDKLSHHELAQALDLDRFETEGILKKHNVTEDLGTVDDYLQDARTLEELRKSGR